MGDHLLDRIAPAVHDPSGELGVVRLAETAEDIDLLEHDRVDVQGVPLAAGRTRQYEPPSRSQRLDGDVDQPLEPRALHRQRQRLAAQALGDLFADVWSFDVQDDMRAVALR